MNSSTRDMEALESGWQEWGTHIADPPLSLKGCWELVRRSESSLRFTLSLQVILKGMLNHPCMMNYICIVCPFLFPNCALELGVPWELRNYSEVIKISEGLIGSFYDGLSQSKVPLLSKKGILFPMASDCNFLLFISSNTEWSHGMSHISLLIPDFWRVGCGVSHHTIKKCRRNKYARPGEREGPPFLHTGHGLT